MSTRWQIAVGLVLFMGCGAPADDVGDESGSETESAGEEVPDFAAEVQPILESACLCHFAPSGGDMTAPYLTLNAGVGLAELVNVDSMQLPSMKRVAPGDPQNSYLVHKLRDTHLDVGGQLGTDPMPPLMALDDSDIQTIEAWITGGAPG